MANMLHVIKIKKRVRTIAYLSRFVDSSFNPLNHSHVLHRNYPYPPF